MPMCPSGGPRQSANIPRPSTNRTWPRPLAWLPTSKPRRWRSPRTPVVLARPSIMKRNWSAPWPNGCPRPSLDLTALAHVHRRMVSQPTTTPRPTLVPLTASSPLPHLPRLLPEQVRLPAIMPLLTLSNSHRLRLSAAVRSPLCKVRPLDLALTRM